MVSNNKYMTIKEASALYNTNVSNIRYLLDYHPKRIHRYNKVGIKINKGTGSVYVSKAELDDYYEERLKLETTDISMNKDTNSEISFRSLSDAERTKHVHGLHPYMGKFIPQLAEYYLKKYFKKGDIILDPFGGSGTTLIEANVLSMHSIGIDIAEFNTILMKAKLNKYNLDIVEFEIKHILNEVTRFSNHYWNNDQTTKGLLTEKEIKSFENKIKNNESVNIHENLNLSKLIELFDISTEIPDINKFNTPKTQYLKEWLAPRTNIEVNYYSSLIPNYNYQDILKVILSASIRSSRLIKHIDLTRPTHPLKPGEEYICKKHRGRICKPINQALKWIRNHSIGKKGAINRLNIYGKIQTEYNNYVFHGDSKNLNIYNQLSQINSPLITGQQFIDGVFTSPPYVGVINYHEQHKYAYDIFNLKYQEELEIGSAQIGNSKIAREKYKQLISNVLINIKPFLVDNANLFIVANDKYNLYSDIFMMSGYKLINKERRGVYKRADSGGARANYDEIIFQITPASKN